MSSEDLATSIVMGSIGIFIFGFIVIYGALYLVWQIKRADNPMPESNWIPVQTNEGVVFLDMNDPNVTEQARLLIGTNPGVAKDIGQYNPQVRDYEELTAGAADPRWFYEAGR